MANCFCGKTCVTTSYVRYGLCLSCIRRALNSVGKEQTEEEEELWERLIPPSSYSAGVDVCDYVDQWINVFFFSGDECEHLIPDEDELRICDCGNYESDCECLPF